MSVFDLMMAPPLSLAAEERLSLSFPSVASARSKLTEAWSCPWCSRGSEEEKRAQKKKCKARVEARRESKENGVVDRERETLSESRKKKNSPSLLALRKRLAPPPRPPPPPFALFSPPRDQRTTVPLIKRARPSREPRIRLFEKEKGSFYTRKSSTTEKKNRRKN